MPSPRGESRLISALAGGEGTCPVTSGGFMLKVSSSGASCSVPLGYGGGGYGGKSSGKLSGGGGGGGLSGWGGGGESVGGGGGMSSPSVSGAAVGSAGSACSAPSSKASSALGVSFSSPPGGVTAVSIAARVVFWYSSFWMLGPPGPSGSVMELRFFRGLGAL